MGGAGAAREQAQALAWPHGPEISAWQPPAHHHLCQLSTEPPGWAPSEDPSSPLVGPPEKNVWLRGLLSRLCRWSARTQYPGALGSGRAHRVWALTPSPVLEGISQASCLLAARYHWLWGEVPRRGWCWQTPGCPLALAMVTGRQEGLSALAAWPAT